MHGELFWRYDNDNVRFFIMCSDVFAWGTADCEELTPDNIHELRKAHDDLCNIDPKHALLTGDLFAARMRKMRPQGAAYPTNKEIWPLLDACGPERELDALNPFGRPDPE